MSDEIANPQEQLVQVLVAGKLYAPEAIIGPVAVVLEGTTIRDIWQGLDAASAREYLGKSMPT